MRIRWQSLTRHRLQSARIVALWMLPGVPTHCGTLGSPACAHDYVFNNHGTLIVTDRAGFSPVSFPERLRMLNPPALEVPKAQ